MSKTVPDIIHAADQVSQMLKKMAYEGNIEAAAVTVKNLAWIVDMQGQEGWALSLENVDESTVATLTRDVIFNLELIGLGWDDWDIYTEFPDEDGSSNTPA